MDSLANVSVGDSVSAGDFMGTVGNTGNAAPKGSHIHFNIYKRGQSWEGSSTDPHPFMISVYPNLEPTYRPRA